MYTILVCDDEKDIVSALNIYLSAEGYRVLTAYDGYQALRLLDREEVHLILLDVMMPGMDGIHLAQALRRLRSDIIIVFATAHPKFAVEALKMKADYIIFKPFDREDIADVMERAKLLRRRQCNGRGEGAALHGAQVP